MTTLKERVRMALAEAGYPNAGVDGTDDDPSVHLTGPRAVPDFECWRAFRVAGCLEGPCFPCWMADNEDCDHVEAWS